MTDLKKYVEGAVKRSELGRVLNAIKLTRADAVKLVAGEMIELAAHDVDECEKHVVLCHSQFCEHVIELASDKYYDALSMIGMEISLTVADMHMTTTYCVYEDGSDSGTTAQVIFADRQQTYEARFRVELTVNLDQPALMLRGRWVGAMLALRDARERDLRVGAMKKEARELLVKAALDDSPEGADVVATIKALAKSLKGKA